MQKRLELSPWLKEGLNFISERGYTVSVSKRGWVVLIGWEGKNLFRIGGQDLNALNQVSNLTDLINSCDNAWAREFVALFCVKP